MRLRVWLCGALALLASCEEEPIRPDGPAPVATVILQPDSANILVGATAQLTATLRDAGGTVLTGRTITWSSSDQTRATVSTSGLVTGISAGRVVIAAISESRRDSTLINVTAAGALDFSIVDAQFTQAVQGSDGLVPMVLGGNAAVVNVLISSTRQDDTTPLQVVLRLYNANSTLTRTDTAIVSNRMNATTTYALPAVQFLVPATTLSAGMQWQVEADPRQLVAESNRSNNIFPRTGRRTQPTATVPALKVRFVPMVLSAHNNSTVNPAPSTAQLTEYLRKLRAVHPLATITATIGTSLTTSANFGTAPSGGQVGFWQQVLADIDLARMTNPVDPEVHWYGLLHPPPTFNFTTFGGFSYIPSSGQATGVSTRTGASVALGWFNNTAQSRELVAHELGHNFGRRHAPCGDASNADPSFPNATGTIGIIAHNVFDWANGTATSAAPIDPGIGDLMGYCFPTWVSEYTYRGVLNFRGGIIASVAQPPVGRTRVVIVRGHIDNGRTIELDPTFTLDGRPSLPERSGSYLLEGRTVDGRVLFAHNFEPAELDHAPNVRPFAFALELSPADQEALHTIEVRGPGAAARIDRPRGSVVQPQVNRRVSAQRAGDYVTLRCPDSGARGLAVVDENGELMGTARASFLRIALARNARVTVVCSDGVRSERLSAG